MALTSSQRKRLRGIASTRPDDLRLGKDGLSEGFIATLGLALARRELVKLRFGKDVIGDERAALAQAVAAAAQAECVGVIGRTMLLYKPNPELEASKRVLADSKAGEA